MFEATPIEIVYTGGLHLARPLLPLLARGEGKLARGIRGRRGAVERLERWAAERRDAARPLVWFHAPSVGEGLQALAVIEALRSVRPDVQLAYTFFSPSAESFARKLPVEVADYLPIDLPREADRCLEALAPDVIAFSKSEVWPNLTREAARRGIPTLLLSATLPRASTRLRRPARALLAATHARLARVAAISPGDAARFAALDVPPARTTVMGDARFDQVWRRAQAAGSLDPTISPLLEGQRPTIVAGSTWPADEDRLIEALADMQSMACGYRLILVPHEPTAAHLERLDRRLAEVSLAAVRLGALGTSAVPDVVVVDRVGVLGDLYRLADVAYVGGGFGKAGLHSVLEPAAFGVPVLFGPHHANAREAAELIAAGGAREVRDGPELGATLRRWLERDEDRRTAGSRALDYVRLNLGAARRGAALIEEFLPPARGA